MNTLLNAQTQHDSLAKYSYEELKSSFLDSGIREYVDEYLRRAKNDKDTIKMARGYYYYNTIVEDELALKYADSIIIVSNHINDHNKYPVLGYYSRGITFYNLGKNKEALDNFLIALNLLKINKNESLEIEIINIIYILKNNWENNKLSMEFTEKYFRFLESKKKYFVKSDIPSYLDAIYNLGVDYIKNNRLNESLNIAKRGILEAKEFNYLNEYYDFVSLSGTAQYYLNNYQEAIDSLQKALPYRRGQGKAMSNYYLGKSYNKLNQPEKAQFHFLKTDSIYQTTKDIFPEMRNAYEHIIDYYKSKNDAENQIKYYDRLLEADKVIDSTYTYVTETIEKKYETPQAIAERARLLEELESKKNSWKYSFGIISAVLLAVLGILLAVFRRQKYYKQRFENIMSIERSRNASTEKQTKDIGVSEEIVENILNQLKKFEASQKFTKQVSLTDLSKNFKTNPKYLSKVINWHHKKSFSHYISELRIEYVISKLKEDSKFRNYTIKAIGKEAGFGNTESFSKAFHKSTGIKPSYFIKELHKRLES